VCHLVIGASPCQVDPGGPCGSPRRPVNRTNVLFYGVATCPACAGAVRRLRGSTPRGRTAIVTNICRPRRAGADVRDLSVGFPASPGRTGGGAAVFALRDRPRSGGRRYSLHRRHRRRGTTPPARGRQVDLVVIAPAMGRPAQRGDDRLHVALAALNVAGVGSDPSKNGHPPRPSTVSGRRAAPAPSPHRTAHGRGTSPCAGRDAVRRSQPRAGCAPSAPYRAQMEPTPLARGSWSNLKVLAVVPGSHFLGAGRS
jgi:hypothetical protein